MQQALFSWPTWLVVWIDANPVEQGCHTPPKAKSYSLGLIIHIYYWKSMLWSVDSCQNKVSADQHHVTILLAQVLSSPRAHVFFFFEKGWLLTNYWFLLGLWAQVRLICESALGCSEGIISLLLCYVVWDCWNSQQKSKQYKQKTSLQCYKTQIKILTYPGLA